jgi:hypothetical protein
MLYKMSLGLEILAESTKSFQFFFIDWLKNELLGKLDLYYNYFYKE